VDGERARLYVHSNEHPTLMVNDVKSGTDASGGVALWLETGTVAHFGNLTSSREKSAARVRKS